MASKQLSVPFDERFTPGGIYIILFLRPVYGDDVPTFHWGIYHHSDARGHKYHIKNITETGWITDFSMTRAFMKSMLLVGLVEIGYFPPSEAEVPKLHELIDGFDLSTIPPGYTSLTCRTWTLHTASVLVDHGYVNCDDISALEAEVTEFGLSQYEAADKAEQPRPIIRSTVCGF